MKNSRYSLRVFVVLGLALLGGSLVGAVWVMNSRAGDVAATGSRDGSSAADPTRGRVVCFGYGDVEPGITPLYPVQAGRVEQVKVVESQEVKAGDVLLSLDSRLADLLVRQARADLEAAQAQYDQATKLGPQQTSKEAQQQAAIDFAELALKRKEELRGVQVNSQEIDMARAALRAEEKKLEELKLNDPALGLRRAEAELHAKEARLDQALLGRKECDLKAPADGTVLRLLASRGETLGSQPKQPAILFCPKGPRIIRAEVDQEFAARVAVGQDAYVQDDGSASLTWRGKVTRMSDWYTHRRSIIQEPLQLNDIRTLECLITLDPGQPPIRIGQRVRVMLGQ